MGVTATCTDCKDEHPLADREAVPGTTICPRCGSTSYRSEANGDGRVSKSEADRIQDAISDVRGVGDETIKRIINRYSLYAELEMATIDELIDVKNVGQATAERIQEKV